MPEPTHADRAPNSGLIGHAMAWLAALLAHFRARLELAGIEGREAAVHYGLLLGLAVAGLVFLIFGYFFLCLALVFLLGWACGGGNAWIWVLLGMAVLHFAGAAALGLWARTKLGVPMFAATLDELRKDQEWLTSTTGK